MNWGGLMVGVSLVFVGALTLPFGLIIWAYCAWIYTRG